MGEVRAWWWDGDSEVGPLRHAIMCGDSRRLGVGNEAGTTRQLFRLRGFCSKAHPPPVDHEGEATAVHDEEHRDDPCSDESVSVYKLTDARIVPIR